MKKTRRTGKTIMSFLLAMIMVVSSSFHIFAANLDENDFQEYQQEVYIEGEAVEETVFTEVLFELSLEDLELNLDELLQNSELDLVELDLVDLVIDESIQRALPRSLFFDAMSGMQNRAVSRGFDYAGQWHIYSMNVSAGRPFSILMSNLTVGAEVFLVNSAGFIVFDMWSGGQSQFGTILNSNIYRTPLSRQIFRFSKWTATLPVGSV